MTVQGADFCQEKLREAITALTREVRRPKCTNKREVASTLRWLLRDLRKIETEPERAELARLSAQIDQMRGDIAFLKNKLHVKTLDGKNNRIGAMGTQL